jgi:ATP/maltotriose-dependent transcriptional regulator MalT
VAVGLEGAEDADRAGLGPAHGAFSALNAAEAAFELGRWDIVERVTADVRAGPAGSTVHSFAHCLQGLVSNARGDLDAAEEHLRRQRELLSSAAGAEMSRNVPELEAEIALSQRRPRDAARAAAKATRLADRMSDPVSAARGAMLGARAEADCAEVARARRARLDEEEAIARAGAILGAERIRTMGDPAARATIEAEVARACGRSDPAGWAAAARACEARGAAWQSAYAWWRFAEAALARAEGRAQATEALATARAVAQRLEAAPLMGEVDGLARRARIELAAPALADATPAPAPDAARDVGLTARELEVLEHVALGQTNREIAADLFISVRTAAVHVSHILDKLGASTRTEAATAAHRLGLVP